MKRYCDQGAPDQTSTSGHQYIIHKQWVSYPTSQKGLKRFLRHRLGETARTWMPLTNVYLFTLTGITMGNEYPLQNAILRKDTLEREILGVMLDL